ncbi:MAG: CDP-glycerol glycerophosphotransferase family protein [Clostridia bacterium]|nr:CDP-glycerol glycerophosphotransferase family protein [Clostridia bacterium]
MSFIKGLAKKIINKLPTKRLIMFESAPDLSDNSKAVFDEMIKRGLNKKYKMLWLLSKEPAEDLPKIKNVSYIKMENSKRILLKKYMARCFICCNDWLWSLRDGQTSFYLSHGTTIKCLSGYYNEFPEKMDYCLSAGEDVAFLCEAEFGAPKEKIFSLGFPRNDALVGANRDLHPMFPECSFKKIIVWYPTYRQHQNGGVVSKGSSLPIIHDPESAKILNDLCKKEETLIVLKPHFAQDVSYVKDMGLSNIRFIDDSFFKENSISSYEFVGSCDALITDYSSIYYDFTLCDKPIALVWEDYEEYKKVPGFAEGTEELLEGGEKVYTLAELCTFVSAVSAGEDRLRDARRTICRRVNFNGDGNSSARVTDFIIEKAGL